MAVTRVKGIKKFTKGMCLKKTYMWTGEPTKTYYHKVIDTTLKGTGANTKIYKVVKDGKKEKLNQKSFLWDYETQIGKVKPSDGKGWGRAVKTKC